MKKLLIALLVLSSCAPIKVNTTMPIRHQTNLYNYGCPFGGTWQNNPNQCPNIFDRVLGRTIGAIVGGPLDKNEIDYSVPTILNTLNDVQDGTVQYWLNPQTRTQGSIVVNRTINNCREFTLRYNIQGQLYEGTSIACLENNQWNIYKGE